MSRRKSTKRKATKREKVPRSRTPPDKIKFALRREVRFGCPDPGVEGRGCGSPFLTYHHFDPPWKDEHHHRITGLIALCWTHHTAAKGYTKEELHRMKREPFLADRHVAARFDLWNRRRLSLFAGGNWYINPTFVLRIGDHTAIGLTQPMGNVPGGIDLDVRDREGRPVLSMKANDWNLDVIPDDLECSSERDSLHVEHAQSGVELTIKFASLEREQLDGFLERYCQMINRSDLLISLQHAVWPIAVARLTGHIPWPGRVVLNEYQTFNGRVFFPGNIYDHTGGIQL